MKKLVKSIKDFGRKNPARIYTFASIFSVYLAKKVPGLPIEVTILTIAALYGLGESVQRVENNKTKEALSQNPSKGDKNGKTSR